MRRSVIAILGALAFCRVAYGQSECTRSAACNSQRSDSLDFAAGACLDGDTRRYQLFTFSAFTGTRVIATVNSATFAPALQLIDPSNQVYAANENAGRASSVRIDTGTNASGTWTVRVRNIEVGTGGPYTLTLECFGGSQPPPPDQPPPAPTAFQISVTPNTLTLTRGASGSVRVRGVPIAPFSQDVHVSVATPAGVKADPQSFTFPAPGVGDVVVRIEAGPNAAGGSFPVTFTGVSSDGTVRAAGLSLTIDAPCTPPFLLNQLRTATTTRGASAALSVSPNGTPPFAFQWYRGFGGSSHFPDPIGTSATYVTAPLTSDEQFWVRITNECGSRDSDTIDVKVTATAPRKRATRH